VIQFARRVFKSMALEKDLGCNDVRQSMIGMTGLAVGAPRDDDVGGKGIDLFAQLTRHLVEFAEVV